MDNDLKKAIVTVTNPFRLYQAIYLTYLFPEYTWDILHISYLERKTKNSSFENICKKANRFNRIFTVSAGMHFTTNTELFLQCIKMFIYFIIGKRKDYAKKIILQSVETFDYDMICVECSYTLVEGALLCFSKEKKVIIMEEGMDDYISNETQSKLFNGPKSIAAKLLYKMQYINLLYDYHYIPLKYCEKYVRYPELIRANHFKNVNKILDFTQIDQTAFIETIRNSFEIGDELYDVVIYTEPLFCYGLEREYTKFIQYIKDTFINKKILVKRHPRDSFKYNFGTLDVAERYFEIPGEMILQQWKKAVHVFTFPSTISLGIGLENINYKVIKFTSPNQSYNFIFDDLLNFFKIPSINIVKI